MTYGRFPTRSDTAIGGVRLFVVGIYRRRNLASPPAASSRESTTAAREPTAAALLIAVRATLAGRIITIQPRAVAVVGARASVLALGGTRALLCAGAVELLRIIRDLPARRRPPFGRLGSIGRFRRFPSAVLV